jgi:23S rRNA pseudouridine955/2504/2580 synthase/23S rRNA pseudouridine1911/1915/1917 synthase
MREIEILYQDENIIAVSKPSGLPVLPIHNPNYSSASNAAHLEQENLYGILKNQFRSIFPLHSIDKDASGIILCAKKKEIQEFLSGEFRNLKVERRFLVLLSGFLEEDEGEIKAPISISKRAFKLGKTGRTALTKYKTIERFKSFTLAEAFPVTHNPFQIRMHFWSISHPLAVDGKYSTAEPIFLSSFKKNYKQKSGAVEKPLISRLTLHLQSLTLQISKDGGKKEFACPLPKDFEITLKHLRKYN